MIIYFIDGTTITTQEAADLVEKENKLGCNNFIDKEGLRCVFGVIGDWSLFTPDAHGKMARKKSIRALEHYKVSVQNNDTFVGTPEERCQEFVKRLRAIP